MTISRPRAAPCQVVLISALLTISAVVLAPRISAQTCNGPGTERWPIKVSVPGNANLDQPKSTGLNELLRLEDPPGITHNDLVIRTSAYRSSLTDSR